MAAIHPSRQHLIRQSDIVRDREIHTDTDSHSYSRRDRSTTPPRRQDRDRERDSSKRDDGYQDRRRDRNDEYGRRSSRSPRRRSRSRSPMSDRDRGRRGSPSYDNYTPPPRQNMYGSRAGNAGGQRTGGGYGGWASGGGGSEWMEQRRRQREASTLNIWPPSPKAPFRESSPSRHKSSSKKQKRSRSSSVSASSDADSEDDRRRRRHKKRSHSDKHHRSSRHKSHRSKRRDDSVSEGDSEDDRRRSDRRKDKGKGKERDNRRTRSPSASRSVTPDRRDERRSTPPTHTGAHDEEEDQWVEAAPRPAADKAMEDTTVATSHMVIDEDDEVGPMPLPRTDGKLDERAYGGALLRGEGSAMAAYVQDGQRIPRRGEIGLTSDQIDAFEKVGYVMSGSRHRRMNAVRMRKENQVISAEEKRSLLKMQKEEKMKREGLIVGGFKEILEEKLKAQGQR
ncbi:hypothetical protein FRB99_000037 [Tulasnella sp. 403]|nr:hypothetical protein FRB99_000037 [Tulasnella sp. 403]